MKEFDQFSDDLLEQSKRFLERAKNCSDEESKNANLNAALLISVSSLEAYINGIVEDFSSSEQFNLVEKSFLQEKEIEKKNGEFFISKKLKMSRLTERIEVLSFKFAGDTKFTTEDWWSALNEGILMRNDIVHPKQKPNIKVENVERTLLAIIECINYLFLKIYHRGLPSKNMELQSKYNF